VNRDNSHHAYDWLVLGGDIGGTSTRILVAANDGTPIGRGTAGGGNPVSHPDTAAESLASALRDALTDIAPARVRTSVVGVAGGSALRQSEVRSAFDEVWIAAGLTCAPRYVSDLEVAFASGTSETDGTLLIAGTGAVAGAVRDRRLVKTADGHGWLLGDDGSGFWLGREAARATLRALDEAEAIGPLAESVLRALGVGDADIRSTRQPELGHWRMHVIHSLNKRPPVRLAELAPLVTQASAAGDPSAEAIVAAAVELLSETVGRVRQRDEHTPIVLAGRLAQADSPVGARLRTRIAERFSGAILSAQDGVGGAAWLALATVDPGAATAEARSRLIAT